ncbi:hypothetical protein ABS767_10845 [Sphingomonas sp. ST-64]|uniref:Lipoprotein n=1 Tax=Sphingomonas plantiphila TaxID=3163295 RepID=A0ABW8YME8_9SPHN
MAAALIGTANLASACLTREFEDHVFLGERPDVSLPAGLMALRVEVLDAAQFEKRGYVDRAVVVVLESKAGLIAGQRLHLNAVIASSCSRWGKVDGPAYVIGKLVSGPSGPVFQAASYRYDQVISRLRGSVQ